MINVKKGEKIKSKKIKKIEEKKLAEIEKKSKKRREEKEKEKEVKEEKKEAKEKPTELEKKEKEVKVKKEKKIELIKFYEEKKKVSKEKKWKPKFLRQQFGKFKRLRKKWRACRGIDSKKIEEKRGKGFIPKIGYKNLKKIRNLVKGFKVRIIKKPSDLISVNSKEEGIIISKNVGRRKRNEIINEANKLKIVILNPKKGEIELEKKKKS